MPHQPTQTDSHLDKWSFALDSDGDIAWDYAQNQPELVDGPALVKQDLLVALDTYEGEDPLDDRFGLDVFAAVRSNPQLRHEVTRTIEYDDYRHNRVRAVTNVEIQHYDPGSRSATVAITARLDDDEPLQLVFDLFRGTVSVSD